MKPSVGQKVLVGYCNFLRNSFPFQVYTVSSVGRKYFYIVDSSPREIKVCLDSWYTLNESRTLSVYPSREKLYQEYRETFIFNEVKKRLNMGYGCPDVSTRQFEAIATILGVVVPTPEEFYDLYSIPALD